MVDRPCEHIAARTWHGRIGAVRHSFRFRLDYVLIDPEAPCRVRLFGRNRWALASVHDLDHGGMRGAGEGAPWARRVLAENGLAGVFRLRLLTQPRWFGRVFNPVSFWLAFRGDALVAAIAEVNNTYGDRHSYLCRKPGFAPIAAGDVLTAAKVFHVSPFRDVSGSYAFSFDMPENSVFIRIAHRDGNEVLVATLSGARRPLTAARLLGSALRFPLGGLRAIALIHWQALRLGLKRVPFRPRPQPPAEDITT